MLFVLVIIFTIVMLVACHIFENHGSEHAFLLTMFGGILGLCTSVVLSIVIICCNVGIQGQIASKQATYDSLVYQAENNIYENDNDLGKKELANQIQEWNEKISEGKTMQHDFWVGNFYPDIYDNFETIPMDILKGE